MSEQFNKLSPAEHERLAILLEECAEVQQIIGKILRHGYNNFNPANPDKTNRVRLSEELGDVQYQIDWMCKERDLNEPALEESAGTRQARMKPWLRHQ